MPSAVSASTHGRRRASGGTTSTGRNFVATARPSTTPPRASPLHDEHGRGEGEERGRASMCAFVTASTVTNGHQPNTAAQRTSRPARRSARSSSAVVASIASSPSSCMGRYWTLGGTAMRASANSASATGG